MLTATNELVPPALDWAVLKAHGCEDIDALWPLLRRYGPSKKWKQGGPIIEREGISVRRTHGASGWTASVYVAPATLFEEGPTPLIAAMRCFVASKLGDMIDIPDRFKEN